MTNLAALAGRIREQLTDIGRTADRAGLLAERAAATGDDGYWDGVALNLHGFYTGVEKVLEDIAREVDGSVPSGPDWHRDLLIQLAAEMPGLRPAVLSGEARACLEDYRGFRHVVRNLYTFRLRAARLQDLVDALPGCRALVERDLRRFADFLAATNPAD